MTELAPSPVLHLAAGPNGSGKSTLVIRRIQPTTGLHFVNADDIAAAEWHGAEEAHAYDASRLAADQRRRLIEARTSFITETVFSHPSKVHLVGDALDRDYLVHLHVVMVPVDVSVGRVAFRVRRGGHAVPEQKIRERHARLWAFAAQARDLASTTTVYDNGSAATPFRVAASYRAGSLIGEARWPSWTPSELR